LRLRPVDPAVWSRRISSSFGVDTVIVTSRAAVSTGVVPWLARARPRVESLQFWAVGPGTAAALRAIGARKVRQPRAVGAGGILKMFREQPPKKILYFRSDKAGPALARQLRRLGHRVTDLVVYRLGEVPRVEGKAQSALRAADLLVATSPSSLANLRRGLDGPTFLQLRRSTPLIVLGERSRRAARGHGFRRVSVAPSTAAQGFTRYLLRELRDAPA
jgi:uroporphyrinogen-III synthase